MHRYARITASLVLSSLLLLPLAAPAAAQRSDYDHDQVIERTFAVEPGQALLLDTDFGTVRVRGGSGDEVAVTVVKGAKDMSRSEAEERFERFEVDFQQTERGITIDGRYDGKRSWWRGNRIWVEYEVTVPREFDVDVRTSGGSIRAEGFNGVADLKTSGGSVTVLDLDGPLDVNTSGGSITAEAVGGEATLHTSGGSITARDVKGEVECKTSGGSITVEGASGDVVAHTSGGSIRLDDIYGTVDAHTSGGSIRADVAVAPDGPMKLETSGGSITLSLANDARVDIDAKASGGRVKTDMPVTVEGEIKRDRLRGAINGGGPLLTLRSSGGGISINRR